MLPQYRIPFNQTFSHERYLAFVAALETRCGAEVHFRLSETPCFFPASLLDRLTAGAAELIAQLLDNPDYRRAADETVPPRFHLLAGEKLPTCLQVDLGLVATEDGLDVRLVELQAFPSLYGFQLLLADTAQEIYELDGLTPLLGDLTRDDYLRLMRRVLVSPHEAETVVLMEIDPVHQKTWPDFTATHRLWGVEPVNVSDIVKEGRQLFRRRDGRLTRIARIYNRVIPDELERTGAHVPFDFRDDLDVEWIGGPDWFFRISKFSIPWLRHPWVPRTHYLSEISEVPGPRENWLLKPLFSFAGGGIVFAPTDAQLAAIPPDRRHLYILQERVSFTPIIQTPYGPTKAELRIMFIRDGEAYRPVIPLVRMGRGLMMGVDHNKGLEWVGAAAALIDRGA